jgi:micrococcal nuclease
LISHPRYFGTQLGEIVRAISIESKHTWRDIQETTGFSETTLNYHLARLFSYGAISKEKGQYYLDPKLEAEWQTYCQYLTTPSGSAPPTVLKNDQNMGAPRHGFNTKRIIFIAIILLSLGLLASAPAISRLLTPTVNIDRIATCTRIIDGDTFDISSGIRVRLADIDAPESYEPGCASSTNALSSWIQGKQLYLDVDDLYGTDPYGRYVCVVYVAEGPGYTNVNHALLTSGHVTISNYPNEFDPNTWRASCNIDSSEAVQDSTSSTPSSSTGSSSSSSSSTSSTGYWASRNSNIYHKPSCYWAQQISPYNLIVFSSRSAAEAAGYRACQVCEP